MGRIGLVKATRSKHVTKQLTKTYKFYTAKTKEITLANHNGHKQPNEPIKTRSDSWS